MSDWPEAASSETSVHRLQRRAPLRGRDAVHAAPALTAGFTEFVTADVDFDQVTGLTRIDPHDLGFLDR